MLKKSLLVLLMILASGCGKKNKSRSVVTQGGNYGANAGGFGFGTQNGAMEAEIIEMFRANFAQGDDRVFFAFDSSDPFEKGRKSKAKGLTASEIERNKRAVDAIAKFLLAHPNIRIVIHGHCDKYGTVEYNFVLGGQRSDYLKKLLVALGVSPDRIETVSQGNSCPLSSNDKDNRVAVVYLEGNAPAVGMSNHMGSDISGVAVGA